MSVVSYSTFLTGSMWLDICKNKYGLNEIIDIYDRRMIEFSYMDIPVSKQYGNSWYTRGIDKEPESFNHMRWKDISWSRVVTKEDLVKRLQYIIDIINKLKRAEKIKEIKSVYI